MALQVPQIPDAHVLILGLCVSGAAVLIAVFLRRRWVRRFAFIVATALAAACWALLAAQEWQQGLVPHACEGFEITAQATVADLPKQMGTPPDQFMRVDLILTEVDPPRCAGPRRVRAYSRLEQPLAPGDSGRAVLRLKRPHGAVNPHQLEGERWALTQGLHGVGTLRDFVSDSTPNGVAQITGIIHRKRDELSKWIRRHVDGDPGVLAAALAVGDTRYLPPDTWELLRRFGLTHLLVISGLHISMAAAPGLLLGRLLGAVLRSRSSDVRYRGMLTFVMMLVTAGAYAVLAGMSLPVQRALLMLVAVGAPLAMGRAIDTRRSLAFAALTIFIFSPLSVMGASFYLSFFAVALIGWILAWRPSRSPVIGLLRVQVLIQIGMLPLSLFWFAGGAGVGSLINLVAVPVMTFWVLPFLLGSVAVFLGGFSPSLAESVLGYAALPITWLWRILSSPTAKADQLAPLELPVTLSAAVMLNCAFLVGLLPRVVGGKPLALIALLITCVVSIRRPSDSVWIDVLDVGQGTSLIVRQRDKTLLYDTAGGAPGSVSVASRSVLPVLRAQGVSQIDLMVLSHSDQDHSGGLVDVQRTLEIQNYRFGGLDPTERPCRIAETLRLGRDIRLQFLAGAQAAASENNASCVLRVSAFGRALLLPGDIDSQRERDLVAYWGAELRADILLAAHHGSGSSTGGLWLRRVRPQYLVVSAGYRNRFGHPAQRVVDSAARQNLTLLSTADHGAISFEITSEGDIHCRIRRHSSAPFWRAGTLGKNCRAD
ncbi:MAG: DNA internalization-related competence protein ComEC/Rec2 [Congregibacter sp.]